MKKVKKETLKMILCLPCPIFLTIGGIVRVFSNEEENMIFEIILKIWYSFFSLFCLVLTIGGIASIIEGLRYILIYKRLVNKKCGYVTEATYSDNASDDSGDMYFIYYSYVDEKGKEHHAESAVPYYKEYVEYIISKEKFSIRCKGNISVITELF